MNFIQNQSPRHIQNTNNLVGVQPRRRKNTENSVASMSQHSDNSDGIGKPGARSKIAEGDDENSSESEEDEDGTDTVSIAASDQLDQNMDEITNIIAAQKATTNAINEEKSEEDFEDPVHQHIWRTATGEYDNSVDKEGPKILKPLANSIRILYTEQLDPDLMKGYMSAAFVPANCKFLQPKKVNKAIWSNTTPGVRSLDVKIQQVQSSLSKAQATCLYILDKLTKGETDTVKLIKLACESFRLSGYSFQLLNQIRRDQFKPSLSDTSKGLCSNVLESESLLFGDDLQARISELQATAKTVKEIAKPKQAKRKTSDDHREGNKKKRYSSSDSRGNNRDRDRQYDSQDQTSSPKNAQSSWKKDNSNKRTNNGGNKAKKGNADKSKN